MTDEFKKPDEPGLDGYKPPDLPELRDLPNLRDLPDLRELPDIPGQTATAEIPVPSEIPGMTDNLQTSVPPEPPVNNTAYNPPQPAYYEQPGVNTTAGYPAGYQHGNQPVYYPRVYVPYGYTPGTYAEKTNIRRTLLPIGIFLLLVTVFFQSAIDIYYGIANLFGLKLAAQRLISDPGSQQVYQIVLSSTAFIVFGTICMKIARHRPGGLMSFKAPERGRRCRFSCSASAFAPFRRLRQRRQARFLKASGLTIMSAKVRIRKAFSAFC